MKKILVIVICFILAAIFTFVIPIFFPTNFETKGDISLKGYVKQDILKLSKEPIKQTKLYFEGKLVGIVKDKNKINEFLNDKYTSLYKENFPNTVLNLGDDYYYSEEYSFFDVSNEDDKILDFIKEKDKFSIKANQISFSDENGGVFAKIYVSDIEKFEKAKKRFLMNFISEESYNKILIGQETDELQTYGHREISLQVREKMTISKVFVDPKKIMLDEKTIFEYLCYGENKHRDYYVVKEGDTLEGVAFNFSNITPRLLVLINPGLVTKINQVLKTGMKLNTTYFTSPLTVVVKKEHMVSEPIYPPNPYYLEDETIFKGKKIVVTEEENGSKDTLYEEIYINGVLQQNQIVTKSSKRVKEPIQAVIKVGTKIPPNEGTGRFIWPLKYVTISCRWLCYINHHGLDMIDRNERHAPIFAADTGTIIASEYSSSYGYMVMIDHNNGFQTLYAHMMEPSPLNVGDVVQRGDFLGNMGNTGIAYGVHLHWEIRTNGQRLDPCSIMPCEAVPDLGIY